MNLDTVPEVQFVLFEIEELVNEFFVNCTEMKNADYDIGEVISYFVEYRKLGSRSLSHYNTYGTTLEDREDGRVLYGACEHLYNELNYLMKTIVGNVVKAMLQAGDAVLIVEVHYESTYNGISRDSGGREKTNRFI